MSAYQMYFEAVYCRTFKNAAILARKWGATSCDVEDAIQNTAKKFWEKQAEIPCDAFFVASVHNNWIDEMRKLQRTRKSACPAEVLFDLPTNKECEVLQFMNREQCEFLRSNCNTHERDLVERIQRGESQVSIADDLRLSPAAISLRWKKLRRRLSAIST